MPQRLTPKIIEAAIDGFEHKKEQLINEFDAQIAELRAMLPGANIQPAATPEAAAPKRKKFSAASRRKMALAQKARWAKIRGESEPTQAAAPPKKSKRKLSAAAKAILVANLKKARAAKAAKAKAATKKTTPARKKAAVKKAAVKTAPAKAAKRGAAPKKTAPAPTPTAQGAV